MFHTGDRIYVAFPGSVPIEMTHYVASDLIDVELALSARSRALATTRVDPECFSRKNLGILNLAD